MTMLKRWDLFRELEVIDSRLSTFFNRAPAHLGWGDGGESPALADWSPAVDITEDDKECLIKAELPGIKKEEAKVTAENGVHSISSERKLDEEKKGRRFYCVERAFGDFERSFSLPEDPTATDVKAEFVDGVLRVHLPKVPAAGARGEGGLGLPVCAAHGRTHPGTGPVGPAPAVACRFLRAQSP